ncbi:MAG TPA: LacI family DNA-binding transcriptional regulator [Bryobacteraceae bacterium]|nr:LacI family DNA-binding transcriptional regulator [Bryobacteraceae bacterium]
MPTIKDVARRAGVGIATVSRTLHNSSRLRPETAARVRKAIEELGYRPNTQAQSLASGRSHMLGLVVSDISNPFFPGLVKGFEEVALGNGYDVFVASTNYDPARTALCVHRMIERKLDGVAIMTSEIDPGLTDSFARHKVPLVFLDVGKVGRGVSNVKIDYACGIAQAVAHLHELGHRRIAFISGPVNLRSAWERREAFLARLRERGNGQPGGLLIEEGDHKVNGGLQAMLRLLARRPHPTAVLASNDLTAIGALRGIRQYGLRVPEDISVVGFDDIQMAEFTEPPLTTVRLPQSEVARLACSAVLQMIRTPGVGSELGVGTSLVIRASTTRARLGG